MKQKGREPRIADPIRVPATNQSRDCIGRIDGTVTLIFGVYNVLSAGGYFAKKVGECHSRRCVN